jgi:acyl-CoA synthetase (AMP-forming)/AMP-acid ligase II
VKAFKYRVIGSTQWQGVLNWLATEYYILWGNGLLTFGLASTLSKPLYSIPFSEKSIASSKPLWTMAPYGRRLLPQVLDEHARSNPTRLYASIPSDNGLDSGFQDITCATMAKCVNFMAHWIIQNFRQNDRFETVAYIGIPDLRAAAVFLAAVKAGYKVTESRCSFAGRKFDAFQVLLPSPRNPPATNISLMAQTGCSKLIYAAEIAPITKQLTASHTHLVAKEIPSFREMMESHPTPFPFNARFADVKDDPVVVLHSSGSTGRLPLTQLNFCIDLEDC